MKIIIFTQDRMTALNEWLNSPQEVTYCGIYGDSQSYHNYEFMMNNENLQTMIYTAKN